MRIPKPFRLFCCFALSLLMSNLPGVAFASTGMISTAAVAEELNRAEAQRRVQSYLDRPDLREALIEQGLSPDEVSSRLASLSEAEMRQLAGQMEEARYGGDILVTVLLVVLIIFLVKRI
ncbi:MAG: PA2779 family protein [Bdellovibrionaceae bacterium]|nr:PA2779 family protein [Pseudobdellovibrionaceae bacterium]MBX3034622.1 PA2779 family protein [Pseudobdellovibrionaceae bacterium]